MPARSSLLNTRATRSWRYDRRMLITVDVDEDLLRAAKALAAREGHSFGKALSELARRGIRSAGAARGDEERTVFAVEANAAAISNEDVSRCLDAWP